MPKPFHTLSFGLVRAAVWRNESDDPTKGVRFNVTFERAFKDPQTDKWTSNDNFGRDDLLVLGKLAEECFSYIHTQQEIERNRANAHSTQAANGNSHHR